MTEPTPPPERPNLGRAIARGALWTGASQYALFGLGIVKTAILARLIGPELFGLLAGATVWSSYFGFARTELRLAVYSSKEEPAVLNTQYLLENLTALASLAIAGLALLVWPGLVTAAAWPLIFILLLAGLFETLTSTPVYLVDRRLRQDVMGRLTIISGILGLLAPVAIALAGQPLLALLADALIPGLVQRLGAAIFIGWRPRLIWDRAQVAAQLKLGWTLWLSGIFGKIMFQFDDWLVFNLNRPAPVVWQGSGVEPEGLYSRAYNIGKMPMDVVGAVIAGIALSVYSESAARGREVLQAIYRQMTWILAWLIFASTAGVFTASGEITHILLGDRWLPMVPLLQLMSLFIISRPFFQNNGQLLMAVRQEVDMQRSTFYQALFLILVCPPAVYFWGAAGACVAVSGMSIVGLLITERMVTRQLGQAAWPIYIVPALCCLVNVVLVVALSSLLPTGPWPSLIAKGICSSLIFGGALLTFERQQASAAWQLMRQGLGKH